jgi:hypothetical protein
MSKKRKRKKIKKLRKIFQQKVASHKEALLEEIKVETNFNKELVEIKENLKEESDKKNKELKLAKTQKKVEFGKNIKIKDKIEVFKLRLREQFKKIKDKKEVRVISAGGQKKREITALGGGIFEKLNKWRKDLKFFSAELSKRTTHTAGKVVEKIKSFYLRLLPTFKKWNNIFCTGMTCQTNLRRDIIVISIAILVAAIFLGMGQYVAAIKSKIQDKKNAVIVESDTAAQFGEVNATEIKIIQDQISTENWKEYQSAWYGFKIKYPQDWKTPVVLPYSRASQALYRVSFTTTNQTDKNYIGFDVVVYDVNTVKEIFKTDEFPKIKSASPEDINKCENIEGHLLETGDYPAEEIYIPSGDDCYGAVLFFSVVNGQYIYNITPRLKDGAVTDNDPMVELSDSLPEFFEAISVFENIDIVRPKPKAVVPKITAPKPATYSVDQFGRRVCEKKNDKPGKSDKGKGKHLDMECCLDPDEYPNPNCYYDPSKYGKYLK